MNLRRLASLSLLSASFAFLMAGSSGCVVHSGPGRVQGRSTHRHCHYRPNARPGMRNLCHVHPHNHPGHH